MNKFIVVGDLHIGKSLNENFLKYQLDLINQIKTEADNRSIKNIVFLGDIFDNRESTNTLAIYQAKNIFDLLKNYKISIITGNHDTYYKSTNEYNTLSILDSYTNITIFNKPTFEDNCIFLPWINKENKDEALKLLNHYRNNNEIKYVFGHLELNGFNFDKHMKSKCEEAIKKSSFDNYQVYTGHFHTKSKIGNITYTGAPFQFTWIDDNDTKGFYVIDNYKETFIRNNQEYFKSITYKDNKFFDKNTEIKLENINKYNKIKILTEDEIKDDLYDSLNSLNVEKLDVVDTSKVKIELKEIDDNITYQVSDIFIEALKQDEEKENLLKLYEKIK